MAKLSFIVLSLFVFATSSFVPQGRANNNVARPTFAGPMDSAIFAESDDSMYWEGEYPPSKVLGPLMSKMPSGLLGLLSLGFLSACAISCYQSGVLQQEPGAMTDGSWVKWYYVLGSFGGPLAWGTHVACLIQRKNGM